MGATKGWLGTWGTGEEESYYRRGGVREGRGPDARGGCRETRSGRASTVGRREWRRRRRRWRRPSPASPVRQVGQGRNGRMGESEWRVEGPSGNFGEVKGHQCWTFRLSVSAFRSQKHGFVEKEGSTVVRGSFNNQNGIMD